MLLDLARDLVARHRWAQALAVLEPEASPDSPAALWAVLARAYLGAGRLRPAVQAARTALAKDGDDVEAIGAVVAVCLATKRQDEALVLARRAITLAPGDIMEI